MPCTALGVGSACPHFVNPELFRGQPVLAKPNFLWFWSWPGFFAPTQAQIAAIPVLARPSGPHPSPNLRISGPGTPFQPPAKPGSPAFRSWGAFPALCQARIPGFSVLGRLSSPLPGPDPRLFGPGTPFQPSARPGSSCFPSWDALPGGSRAGLGIPFGQDFEEPVNMCTFTCIFGAGLEAEG
jgi:hypothetical protein